MEHIAVVQLNWTAVQRMAINYFRLFGWRYSEHKGLARLPPVPPPLPFNLNTAGNFGPETGCWYVVEEGFLSGIILRNK